MHRIPTAAEIISIVEARTSERVDLEFKSEAWGGSDQGKKECLKDITALANTRGGVILVGVKEKENAAEAIVPLDTSTAEAERGRIENLIHAGVEPRVYGVTVELVSVDGGVVIGIAVPRSPARPHRVTSGGTNRFWLRNSTGAYEANVSDLKNMFLQSAEITERAQVWHRSRLARAQIAEVAPKIASDRSALVVHLIPADAFGGANLIDPKAAYDMYNRFQPIGAGLGNRRFVFDGFVHLRDGEKCHGYTLVRRDGIVEAVKIKIANEERKTVPILAVEGQLVAAVHAYMNALFDIGVVPPVYALATVTGVQGHRLIARSPFDDEGDEIVLDTLHLPMVSIEQAETETVVGDALRPMLDALWNAGGYAGSYSFESGSWKRSTT